tara:strand:- start:944 stop:1138 length:195 start_codon:yes stop_codon:yes gene_type:complete
MLFSKIIPIPNANVINVVKNSILLTTVKNHMDYIAMSTNLNKQNEELYAVIVVFLKYTKTMINY